MVQRWIFAGKEVREEADPAEGYGYLDPFRSLFLVGKAGPWDFVAGGSGAVF